MESALEIQVWSPGNTLPASNFAIIDTETTMVPFTETPELVTFQCHFGTGACYYIERGDVAEFMDLLRDKELVFHNAAFDMDVICQHLGDWNYFHPWIDGGKVADTAIMWQLVHLADKGFIPRKKSLKHVCQQLLNVELDKDGEERVTFAQYLGQPVSAISKEHLEYGAKDVYYTAKIYQRLNMLIGTIGNSQRLTLPIQVAGALALNRIYKRGIGFNLKQREEMLTSTEKELDMIARRLATYGWVRGVPGANDRYEQIVKAFKLDLPRTESGQISSKESDLIKFSNNDFIKLYLDYHHVEKSLSFFKDIDSSRIHPQYNLLVNTGRTSCKNPNFQQLPRDGAIRSLFVPKPGHKFIITDYTAIELACLAQVNYTYFGFSKMRDLINEGRDLHKYAASQIYNIEEKDVDKKQRLLAKILNFGLGANMSPATFVDYATGFGVILTLDEATTLKKQWTKVFPEMVKYWRLDGDFGARHTHTTITGRVRADCTYTAYMNTGFQGLAADGAKLALYYLEAAGSNTVGFVHDEIISEAPMQRLKHFKDQQESIMIRAMKQVVPDVDIRVETQIADHFCK